MPRIALTLRMLRRIMQMETMINRCSVVMLCAALLAACCTVSAEQGNYVWENGTWVPQVVPAEGSPEGELALAQAAVYLATAPKSNAVYKAFNLVCEDIQRTQALPVPMHIRNAPTKLMKDLGYGKDYKYPHDFPDHFVDETYLPENLKNRKYYRPTDFGFEKEIKKRLEWWEKKRGQGSRRKE